MLGRVVDAHGAAHDDDAGDVGRAPAAAPPGRGGPRAASTPASASTPARRPGPSSAVCWTTIHGRAVGRRRPGHGRAPARQGVATTRNDSARRPSARPAPAPAPATHGPDAVVEPLALADLAPVAAQGGDLAVEGVGDVDGPVGAGRRHHPDLGHGVGLETLLEELGVGEGVAGVGIGGAHGRLAGRQVVGMAGADAVPHPIGRLAHEALRAGRRGSGG